MTIIIVCNAGMSTGILKYKMIQEAEKRKLEAKILAVPLIEVEDYLYEADVILLGPQISFIYEEMKSNVPDIPVILLSAKDFGSMNAPKILDDILTLTTSK